MNGVHSFHTGRPWRGAALLMALAGALLLVGSARASTMRYALIVGTNVGVDARGTAEVPLRHAEREALAVRDALVAHSGFDAQGPRTLVLTRPSRAELLGAVAELRAVIAADNRDYPAHDVLFLLYYSGHGAEKSLLLRDGVLPATVLNSAVATLGAKVRVLIFDACHSASLDNGRAVAKGVVREPGFALSRALPEDDLNAAGAVWLAASAGDAYEDPDRGSFFSRAFVESLTKARHDGVGITIEAIGEYVRRRTIELARRAFDVEQVPVIRYDISTSGPLRLAWQPQSSATLVIGGGLSGTLGIRYDDGGQSSLHKVAGEVVEQAVNPGHIRVLQLGGGPPRLIHDLTLAPGGRAVIGVREAAAPALSFGRSMFAATRKGADDFEPAGVNATAAVERDATTVFVGAELHWAGGADHVLAPPWIVSAVARLERGPWLARFGVGVGVDGGEFPSWSYDAKALLGSLQLGYGLDVWRLRLSPFVAFSGGQVWQSFGDGASRRARVVSVTGGVTAALEVARGVAVELSLDAGARESAGLAQGSTYRWTAAWGVAIGFSLLL